MLLDINKLYQFLSRREGNDKRRMKMLERRLGLLEPIYKELNRDAFLELWQRLLVELAEIKNSTFELLFETIIVKYEEEHGENSAMQAKRLRSKKHVKKVTRCNQLGYEAAEMYKQIVEILLKEEDEIENQAMTYIQTVCTAKFNIAKIWSRVILASPEERL